VLKVFSGFSFCSESDQTPVHLSFLCVVLLPQVWSSHQQTYGTRTRKEGGGRAAEEGRGREEAGRGEAEEEVGQMLLINSDV